jgi:hypothetical protein
MFTSGKKRKTNCGERSARQEPEPAIFSALDAALERELLHRLPGVLHGFGEFLGREGVEDVVFGEPGSSRLQDAVADFFHVRGVVGVGVDDDLHASLFGLPKVHVAQVEAIRIGVEFHCDFMFCGRG